MIVCDDGAPRNAASHAMHNYLSRDGMDPSELRRAAREEIERYDAATFLACTVNAVERTDDGFRATTLTGDILEARKILLAVGIADSLPRLGGFEAMYGRSVFHCQYCDGWDAYDQPLAVLSEGAGGFRQALMMLGWTRDVVLCTQGPSGLTDEQRTTLEGHQIVVHEQPVVRLEGADGRLDRLIFADGTSIARRILFFHGDVSLSSDLPARIGCAFTDQGRIEVDEGQRTSVAGVFAAGDAARRRGQHPSTQVLLAAASGALAGIALHQELMHEDFGLTPALPRAVEV